MRIHEIISEQYLYESPTQLDEGLKEILLTAGMAGMIALAALSGGSANAPTSQGATKPVPVKITDGGGSRGTTAEFADGSSTVNSPAGLSVYNSAGTLVKTVKPAPGAEVPGGGGSGAPSAGGADAPGAGDVGGAGGVDAPPAGDAGAAPGATSPGGSLGSAPGAGGAMKPPPSYNAPASGGAMKPPPKIAQGSAPSAPGASYI